MSLLRGGSLIGLLVRLYGTGESENNEPINLTRDPTINDGPSGGFNIGQVIRNTKTNMTFILIGTDINNEAIWVSGGLGNSTDPVFTAGLAGPNLENEPILYPGV